MQWSIMRPAKLVRVRGRVRTVTIGLGSGLRPSRRGGGCSPEHQGKQGREPGSPCRWAARRPESAGREAERQDEGVDRKGQAEKLRRESLLVVGVCEGARERMHRERMHRDIISRYRSLRVVLAPRPAGWEQGCRLLRPRPRRRPTRFLSTPSVPVRWVDRLVPVHEGHLVPVHSTCEPDAVACPATEACSRQTCTLQQRSAGANLTNVSRFLPGGPFDFLRNKWSQTSVTALPH